MGQWFRMIVLQSGDKASRIGIYENEKCILEEIVEHAMVLHEPSSSFNHSISNQKEEILEFLHLQGMNLNKLKAIVCQYRGDENKVREMTEKDIEVIPHGVHDESRREVELVKQISKQLNIPVWWVQVEEDRTNESISIQDLAYRASQYLNAQVDPETHKN